jgi:Fibronectin type III domain
MQGSKRFEGQAHWFVLAAAVLLASCSQDGISTTSDSSTVARTPAQSSRLPSASTGNATLSWSAPSENTNGSALTNLAGFKIHYGTAPTQLTNTIALTNPGLLTYVLTELPIGTTYYFAVIAVTTTGVESAPSHMVSTAIS